MFGLIAFWAHDENFHAQYGDPVRGALPDNVQYLRVRERELVSNGRVRRARNRFNLV
jgi:hypothetical protein